MIDENDRRTITRLLEADGANFVELTRLAGLDPGSSFRGADLREVDFSGCNLAGFDFSEADLRGASFLGASLDGALLDDANTAEVQWPANMNPSKPQQLITPSLTPFQRKAVEALTRRLKGNTRAVALMPVGSGASAVMTEIIAWAGSTDRAWSLVIVRGASERNQMIELLRERFPDTNVLPLRDAANSDLKGGIAVHAATTYDAVGGRMLGLVMQLERVASVVTNTIDRLPDLLDGAKNVLGMAPLAAVIPPLLDADRPDRRHQEDRISAVFGDPAYVLELDVAIDAGILRPVRVQIPFPALPPLTGRTFKRDFSLLEELVERFASLSARQPSLMHRTLILCQNDEQARFVVESLRQTWIDGPQIFFEEKWRSVDRLTTAVEHGGGIAVASLSRVAITAAARLDSVVVLAPLDVPTAQEMAFRPRRISRSREPQVLDLAQAFQGFPNVVYGVDD